MGQLISLIAVSLFSLTTFAKTDFSPVIEQNVLEQDLAAEQIHKSIITAGNVIDDDAFVETVKSVPSQNAEAATAEASVPAANESTPATATAANQPTGTAKRTPANENEFKLRLHPVTPTGIASAKRYFPPKPPQPKVAKHSGKKSAKKVAKGSVKGSGKIAKSEKKTKVKKAKNSGRSTASVKKKKSVTQTASSEKI